VTATLLQTYAVNLPANMEVVSATNAADANGKYISGTTITFKASFPYAASNVSDGTNTLEPDADGVYSVTIGTGDITVTATVGRSSTIDLTDASGDFAAINNDVLTGTTSHTVTIANGAKITLSGTTISGGNGIGTGTVGNSKTATVGDIVIKGGTVSARLGSGDIYNGSSVVIGAIKIYDTIDKVDASAITKSVTYMHVENETETDVTASASTYFTIIEDGDRRIIAPKDDTDYSITIADNIEHGSLTGAATAKYMEKVTITATPDLGYRLSRLVVKDADNNDVATTGNTFLMPKGNVTVSAVFEQGTHGTTEFAWGYFGPSGFVREASIYDGLTTVNLQQGQSYQILKYDESSYRKFLLDNDTYNATIPYSGGTGTFPEYGNGTNFNLNDESGFYDITMTDVGNGKWSVSILKTVAVMDAVPDQAYTGSEITPEPLVLAGSLGLTKGTDYEYSYTNNTNVGTAKVTVTFKDDYASIGSVAKTFTIVKATPTVTAPTPVEDLVYSGTAQALVTAGSTDFGTLIYSTDGENYATDIPTATDGGTYTVYYKVEGSDNWNAVDVQTVEVTIAYYNASLADIVDNTDVISNLITNYGSKANVTLSGRTLYKDGKWNTLCLPFGVDLNATDCPLYGATARTVTAASISGSTLNLTFGDAVNTLVAGTPYIIKWDGDGTSNIENPVFEGVTIDATERNYDNGATGDVRVRFCGTYKSTAFDAEDKSILLMGAENTLFYPITGSGIGAQRAYFKIGDDGELLAPSLTAFNIDFGDDDSATGIIDSLSPTLSQGEGAWYSIDGRKLDGKPTQHGIYINNGKKVVIK